MVLVCMVYLVLVDAVVCALMRVRVHIHIILNVWLNTYKGLYQKFLKKTQIKIN